MTLVFVSDDPLDGAPGRIFNALLRTANISKEECIVTHVFDEEIPDHKIKNWCVPLKLARDRGLTDLPPIGTSGYLDTPYRRHLERLGADIAQAKSPVIVPLGGTALWAFSGASNITQMRGTVIAATSVAVGRKVVPTFHPSYIMKKWQHYSIVVRDMQFAQMEMEKGDAIEEAKRTLILEPTLQDITDAVQCCLSSSLLSVDIETGWGQVTCIGFAWDAEHAICVPFVDQRKPNKSYWATAEEELEAWRLVKRICESHVPKCGQNFAGYDALWLLARRGVAVLNLRHDTRLLSHAIYPELPKDLGFLGSAYSTQGAWKHMGKRGDKRDDKSK